MDINSIKKVLYNFFLNYFKKYNNTIEFKINGVIASFYKGDYAKTCIFIADGLQLAIDVLDHRDDFFGFFFKQNKDNIQYKRTTNKLIITILNNKAMKLFIDAITEASDIIVSKPSMIQTAYIFIHGSEKPLKDDIEYNYLSVVPLSRISEWGKYTTILIGIPAELRLGRISKPAILTEDGFTHRLRYIKEKEITYSVPIESLANLLEEDVLIKANEIKRKASIISDYATYECVVWRPKPLFTLESEKMFDFLDLLSKKPKYLKIFLALMGDKKRTLEQKRNYFYKAIETKRISKSKREGSERIMEESIEHYLNKVAGLN